MKTYIPDCFVGFACIADRCKHSCCIGWEIDIDPKTYKKYKAITGPFGQRLQENIVLTYGVASFRLGEGERCMFLNRTGLCDIYSELGEKALCQICTEHPRFYVVGSDHYECGYGLCCEEAGRMLFSHTEPIKLIPVSQDRKRVKPLYREEKFLLDTREQLFAILQDRSMPFSKRIPRLLAFCGVKLPRLRVGEWARFYRDLERLDNAWEETLTLWEQNGDLRLPRKQRDLICCEQLLYYFILRHFSKGYDDERYFERIAFSVHAMYVISGMVKAYRRVHGDHGTDDWVEIARQYSAEIEYSEANLFHLFEKLAIHRLDDPPLQPECNFFDVFYVDEEWDEEE